MEQSEENYVTRNSSQVILTSSSQQKTDEQTTTNHGTTNEARSIHRIRENFPTRRSRTSELSKGSSDAESMERMRVKIAIKNTKTTNDIMNLQKQLIFDTIEAEDGKLINIRLPSIKSSIIRRVVWYGNRIGTKCGQCRVMVITNPCL